MNGGNKVPSCRSQYIETIFVIKCGTIKVPVGQRRSGKQQGSLRKILKGGNNKGVCYRRRCDFLNESGINGRNKKIVWKKSYVCIVRRKIRIGKMRQHIGRTHGCAGDMDEVEVEILKEHHPLGLMAGQLLWLVKVRQILMVGEEGDGVVGSLEVVAPVVEGVNSSKQLPIIDIVVMFSRGEGLGKIGTRMKVTVIISLHEDPSTSKEGRVRHDNKWASNIGEM